MADFNKVFAQVSRPISQAKGSYTVGVNGLDCAGKTTFARALREHLQKLGHKVRLLHVDDFNDQVVQKRVYDAYVTGDFSQNTFDDYYHSSVNYTALKNAITEAKEQEGVTIVEGVFLFREDLADLFDLKVFITVDPKVGRERYAQRKCQLGDTRPLAVFDDIWLPAFERYCSQWKPQAQADLTI